MTWPTVDVYAAYGGAIGATSVASMTWTAIHNNVRSIRIDTPRRDRLLDRVQPGRMTITVDSQAREFDPFNLSGPHVSGGFTQIRPRLPLLVQATNTSPPLSNTFATMFVDTIDQSYGDPREATTTFHALDGFAYLAKLAAPVGTTRPSETVDARIGALLDLGSSWPAADRTLDAVATLLRAEADLSNVNVLEAILSAAEHDHGDCYIDRVGKVRFIGKKGRWTTLPSLYTFSDVAGSTYYYEAIDVRHDVGVLVNYAQMRNTTGATYEQQDATSRSVYGLAGASKLDWQYELETEAEAWATGILALYSRMVDRIVAIVLNPAVDDALWTPVFQLDPGDRITVVKTPPQQASGTISRQCFVEGLTHDVVPASGSTQGRWLTTLWLSDATSFGPAWTASDPPVWDGSTSTSKWDSAAWFY